MATNNNNCIQHRAGATLVEILVVIVIFLVGILGVAQIFPKGLGVLRTSRDSTVANQLARAELERLKGTAEQLPDAILPVRYIPTANGYTIDIDLDRRPSEVIPPASGIRANGVLMDASGGDLGEWPYFSGANLVRRVFGEGRVIPAPRFIPSAAGTSYGGLMALQFAPVVADSRVLPGSRFTSRFDVYGNDLNKRVVDEVSDVFRYQDYTFYIDDDGQNLLLPQGSRDRRYRVVVSYIASSGGSGYYSSSRVDGSLFVEGAGAGPRGYKLFDKGALAAALAAPGETFEHIEVDTIRVQRLFDRVADPTAFSGAGVPREDSAYEYCLLDRNLGMILFNPNGFNYQERRARGRYPLQARVDYDVFDWRIIRDDFRIPNYGPYQQRLLLQNLKVGGRPEPDGRTYSGLGFAVRAANGTPEERDFVLLDLESGGVYAPSCYRIDMSLGLATFLDADGDASNGLSAQVVFPGDTTASLIPDVRGRSVRALYQANGDWSVQAMKAVSAYFPTSSATIGYAQCYVGGSNGSGAGATNRLYFPLADIGKKVVIGEATYTYRGGNAGQYRTLQDQEFIIHPPRAGDLQLGYVDLTDKDPDALAFYFVAQYPVRRVRGASVSVRVTWNPTYFSLVEDPAVNLQRFGTWLDSTRRTETETFLMRGIGD